MSSEDIKTLDELIEYLDNRGQFPLLSEELFMINITWNCSNKRLEKLEAENKRLRQALKVYANTDNWSISYWDNCEVFRLKYNRFDEAKGSMVGEVGGDGEWTLTNGYKIAQEALKGDI